MSRRRKPQGPSAAPGRVCKLYCTDRGQHEPTFLGWIRFVAGNEFPRSDLEPDEPDQLEYLEAAPHARVWRSLPPREWDMVTNFDEFGRARDGHRGLDEGRERWQLSETCPRCPGNMPMKEERLLPVVREAIRTGVSQIDVSRMR